MILAVVRHAESIEDATKYTGFYRDRRPYGGTAAHEISKNVVGLTPTGFRQCLWLAGALADLSGPSLRVFTSTYRRAIDTDGVWRRAQAFVTLARGELDTGHAVVAITHHTTILALRAVLEDRPITEIVEQARAGKTPSGGVLRYELTTCGQFTGMARAPLHRDGPGERRRVRQRPCPKRRVHLRQPPRQGRRHPDRRRLERDHRHPADPPPVEHGDAGRRLALPHITAHTPPVTPGRFPAPASSARRSRPSTRPEDTQR